MRRLQTFLSINYSIIQPISRLSIRSSLQSTYMHLYWAEAFLDLGHTPSLLLLLNELLKLRI
jgi:hypothetical protein